ncbi:MAG: hypothetical protein J5940_07320 [Clostridia bacterium]|nr:hypothetical protein [Clostridia bacterium]
MKAFSVSAAALALLIAALIVNSAFICGRTDELLRLARMLPGNDMSEEGTEETAEKLYSLWDRTVDPFSFTVSYQLIDRADDAVEEIAAAVLSGNDGNYFQARRRFIDALERMKKLQGFTFCGIF